MSDRSYEPVRAWSRRILTAIVLWLPLAGFAWSESTGRTTWCAVFADRLAALGMLGSFVLTAAGIGAHILRFCRIETDSAPAAAFLAVTVGWAGVSLLLLACGCVHLYRPWILLILCVSLFAEFGIGLFGRRCGWDVLARVRFRRLVRIALNPRVPRRFLPAVCTLGVIFTTLLWAAGPVWDWDSEMYHLPLAQFLMTQHGLAVAQDAPLLNAPAQLHLVYGLGLLLGQPEFAALLMWLAAVITSGLAGCFAARWVGQTAAFWTVLVFWSGAIVSLVAATPRPEPFYTLMVLAALSVLYPALRARRLGWNHALVAGLLLGTAGASKYHGLYAWPIIGLWIVWRSPRSISAVRPYACRAASLLLVAVLVSAPWWLKNSWAWGNPFYPNFNHREVELESLTNSNTYGPQLRPWWTWVWLDSLKLFVATNQIGGGVHHYPHYPFLLLPGLLLVRRNQAITTLTLLGLAYWSLALSLSPVPRHLFPVFPLWSIGIGYLISRCPRPGRLAASGLLMLVTLLPLLLPARAVRTPLLLRYLAGLDEEESLLDSIYPGYPRAIRWVNRNLEPDRRLLMCWDARTFRFEADCITDPGGATWRALFRDDRTTPASVHEYLVEQGVGAVLVNAGALHYHVQVDRTTPAKALAQFELERQWLIEAHVLTEVLRTEQILIYEVTPLQAKRTAPSW